MSKRKDGNKNKKYNKRSQERRRTEETTQFSAKPRYNGNSKEPDEPEKYLETPKELDNPIDTEKESEKPVPAAVIVSTSTEVTEQPIETKPEQAETQDLERNKITEEVNQEEEAKPLEQIQQVEGKNLVKEINAAPMASELENLKHPLENCWCFWFFTNENKKNWSENLVELTLFDTVEDYWCLYHHMKLPSEIRNGHDYAVFKRGVQPMWEDPTNKPGGRWLMNIDKRSPELDRIWLDVVLLMIGENFGSSNSLISGAVVNVRSRNKIAIWTQNIDEADNKVIGKKLKEQLRINYRIHFYKHDCNDVLFFV